MKLLFILSLITSMSSLARTYYFNVGGGFAPYRSEVVLEMNMKVINQMINKYSSQSETINLFAAGADSKINDVIQMKKDLNPEQKIVFDILYSSICPSCYLRPNNLKNIDGQSTRSDVVYNLEQIGATLGEEDDFRLYYTGHGAAANHNDFSQNFLALWEETNLDIADFVSLLDSHNKEAHTQVLMVQCYSGGFARMIYEGGLRNNGFSEANRCGFFSQIESRPAAGCTPDLNDREEYSPYFMSAFKGRDEKGRRVNADYNNDGMITSIEAHAHVTINEDSIDIPVSTSSYLIINHVEAGEKFYIQSLDQILSTAHPEEKAIVKGLISELSINLEEKAYIEISKIYAELSEQRNKIAQGSDSIARKYYNLKEKIKKEITENSEELTLFYEGDDYKEKRAALSLTKKEQKKYFEQINSHADYSAYKSAKKVFKEKYEDYSLLDKKIVKVERLLITLDVIIRRQKLMKSDDTDLRREYEKLYNCENKSYFK